MNNNKQKPQFVIFLVLLIITALMVSGFTLVNGVEHFLNNGQNQSGQVVKKAPQAQGHVSNQPDSQTAQNIFNNVASTLPVKSKYNNHGAFVLDNNHAQLKSTSRHPSVKLSNPNHGRLKAANAVITKHTIKQFNQQFTNQTNPKYRPKGWHELTNLPGKYTNAYNLGQLLDTSLVGKVHGFNNSATNSKNIFTETEWTNQADSNSSTGQAYYEHLIYQAAKKGKIIHYQVTPMYGDANTKSAIPYGIHMQALSTDHKLDFNVFVPNIQNNINIDYDSGHVQANYPTKEN